MTPLNSYVILKSVNKLNVLVEGVIMEISDISYNYKMLKSPLFKSICIEARNIWINDLNEYVEKHGLHESDQVCLWSGITMPVKTKSATITRACIISLHNTYPGEYAYAITCTSYNARKFLLENGFITILEETFTPAKSNGLNNE